MFAMTVLKIPTLAPNVKGIFENDSLLSIP